MIERVCLSSVCLHFKFPVIHSIKDLFRLKEGLLFVEKFIYQAVLCFSHLAQSKRS